jgi:hypothetical protein
VWPCVQGDSPGDRPRPRAPGQRRRAYTIPREAERYCPDCARRTPALAGSWLAVIAGILGFVSLACAPLGLVAILLAGIDLVSMATNDKRGRQGLKLDLLAIALSVAGIVLGVLFVMNAASLPTATP